MGIFNQNDDAAAIAPLITQLVDQLASIVVPALQEAIEKVVDGTTITIVINIERKTCQENVTK
jgi:flagellar biosynthesis/type III secretory pathway protein FliH